MSREEIVLENIEIKFRNFEGREQPFNPKGKRNFAIVVKDQEMADIFASYNLPTKTTEVKIDDDGDERGGETILKVKVNLDNERPPALWLITERGRTRLDEETAPMLDFCDIVNVDVVITPYNWNYNGSTGRNAYLKSIYVTINEDPLERKYGVMPVTDETAPVAE